MKRYGIMALASLLLIPLVLLVWGFGLPAQYGDTFLGELRVKYTLLQQPSEKPRLIVVGGSAVVFGVDSGQLEELLPQYEVVNFGLYAALGTRPMLALSQQELRAGDLVILMPEQQAQSLSDYLGAEALWQAADGAFGLLACARWQDAGVLLARFPRFAGNKAAYFVRGGPDLPEVYRRDSFDGQGDLRPGLCPANTMPGGVDTTMPISFDAALLGEDFCTMVNDYVAAAARSGATVWYHFPPMNGAAVAPGSDPDAYCDALRQALDCPLAGSPHTSMLEAGWFYDTNFHLNDSGRQIFTALLARDIKAMLGDTTPTAIPVVTLPDLAEPAACAGDDRDADCFAYAETDTGWQITGLTEAGKTRTELTLPTRWQDRPVTGFEAGAFSASEVLQRLVIQPNIRALPDGAFRGCAMLEQVVLQQDDPAALLVGRNLLEGASCRIVVPADAYDRYCLSYSWSAYAQVLEPAED